MSMLVAGACMTSSGNGEQVCSKTLEAGSKQIGMESIINTAEDKYSKKANKTAYSILGQSGMDVAGGGLFLAKTAIDKNVAFVLPTLGVADSITNQVGLGYYLVKIEWGF